MRRVLERLLNLLAFLLTVGRPVSADEIRTTVAGYDQESDEAFRRMFERDKDLLRTMGIPLERRPTDAWEVEYGYVVPRGEYELPDLDLTDEERAALWLAAQVVRLGGQPSGPEAILKLGGLGLSAGGEPLAADLGASAEQLAVAFQAVAGRRVLHFEYRDRARSVRPYGLLHRRGHWYVVGGDASGLRVYRVDRGTAFRAGAEPNAFVRPAGFRVRDALPSLPWETGDEDLTARVVFDEEVAWWAQRQLPGSFETGEDGSVRAEVRVANPDAFIGWILTFEEHAEILGPERLRSALLARIEASHE